MRNRVRISSGYGQLWWVILLLAMAVILPTVCLLWFMSKAVEDASLAVRQRLINAYQDKLDDAAGNTDDVCLQRLSTLDSRIAETVPYKSFSSLVVQDSYDGLLMYAGDGERIYPLLSDDMDTAFEPAEEFADAWQLEFQERNLAEAVKAYDQKAQSDNNLVRLTALIAKSRCLARLENWDEAIETCKLAAFSPLQEQADAATLALIGNARLLLTKFLKRDAKYESLSEDILRTLPSLVYTANDAGATMLADNNLFIAQKMLEMAQREGSSLDDETSGIVGRIQKLMVAEERSIRIAEYLPTAAALEDWQPGRFRRLQVGEEILYGLYHKTDDRSCLLLLSKEDVVLALGEYEDTFKDSDVVYRTFDDSGRLAAGIAHADGEPFVTAPVGEHFPGWKTELFFKEGDVFEKAANKQTATYIWAGTLMIVLILLVGILAGRVVGRQMRLNKLKNDFIATVSHELKTPLASMRVLVDTLLEGNYKDAEQATEYLSLTSKENERLSRLIDNFLTFSRMERNKQAFEMAEVSPAAIARRAAEAVNTKFERGPCRFEISIDEDLPNISADNDAMVTAIVNLLDNAHKYSYDDKQITLRVLAEDSCICFRVCDNGIGMSRRATRKIFDRFYQVDRSLTRRTEGCGLGLSIVKFIVEAHRGSISVESRPGKGSTFTIKLPAIK